MHNRIAAAEPLSGVRVAQGPDVFRGSALLVRSWVSEGRAGEARDFATPRLARSRHSCAGGHGFRQRRREPHRRTRGRSYDA